MTTDALKTAPSPPTVIARSALFEQLLGSLRDMILDGELAEGSRIGEPELCERFGISRTPLREALKVLASEGLVELQTFRGAFVATISDEEARQVSFVLSTLEQGAVAWLAKQASDAALEHLRGLHRTMVAAARRGDLVTYQKINEAMHGEFVDLTGNPVLIESYVRIKNRLLRVRRARLRSPDDLTQALAHHDALIEALVARRGRRAAAIVERHYLELVDRERSG